jgi:adenylyltransferase/sulfurtransferase
MPIIATVVAGQITEALKLLTGQEDKLHGGLWQWDLWANESRRIRLGPPNPDCPTCAHGIYAALDADNAAFAAVLCGRNAVQIAPPRPAKIDLAALAAQLRPLGEINTNAYLTRLQVDGYEITVFRDARAIIRGTDDVTTARALYAKYVGT